MSEWQPIETAPKNYINVLVFDPGYGQVVAEYHFSFGGMWVVSAYSTDNSQTGLEPTHWMPLPAPPTATGEQP